jgi:hypothetical protein
MLARVLTLHSDAIVSFAATHGARLFTADGDIALTTATTKDRTENRFLELVFLSDQSPILGIRRFSFCS